MRHFEIQLDDLRKRLLEMSGLVESSIYRSVQALVDKDEGQIRQVMENEERINRMQIEIDDLSTGLLLLQQPMAADLRLHHQKEGGVGVDVDPLDGIHLDGDLQGHLWPFAVKPM